MRQGSRRKGTGLESRSEMAKKEKEEEGIDMGAKEAVFHLINNTNQIIQCSTVP